MGMAITDALDTKCLYSSMKKSFNWNPQKNTIVCQGGIWENFVLPNPNSIHNSNTGSSSKDNLLEFSSAHSQLVQKIIQPQSTKRKCIHSPKHGLNLSRCHERSSGGLFVSGWKALLHSMLKGHWTLPFSTIQVSCLKATGPVVDLRHYHSS